MSDHDNDEMFAVKVQPIITFTAIVVIIFAIYGAFRAGHDIVMIGLKVAGVHFSG